MNHPFSSLEDSLLIASPELHGGFFERAVILLTSHTPDEGTSGFILNQVTDQTVEDFDLSGKLEPLHHLSIYRGGPVNEENLFFVAFDFNPEGYFSARGFISAEEATSLLEEDIIIRAFVGFSSWEPRRWRCEVLIF